MENKSYNPINVGAGSLNNPKVKEIIADLAYKYSLSKDQIYDIVDSQFLAAYQAIREGRMDNVHSFKNVQFLHIGKLVMSKTKLIRFLKRLNIIFDGQYQKEYDDLLKEFPNTKIPTNTKLKTVNGIILKRNYANYDKEKLNKTNGTTNGTADGATDGATDGANDSSTGESTNNSAE